MQYNTIFELFESILVHSASFIQTKTNRRIISKCWKKEKINKYMFKTKKIVDAEEFETTLMAGSLKEGRPSSDVAVQRWILFLSSFSCSFFSSVAAGKRCFRGPAIHHVTTVSRYQKWRGIRKLRKYVFLLFFCCCWIWLPFSFANQQLMLILISIINEFQKNFKIWIFYLI